MISQAIQRHKNFEEQYANEAVDVIYSLKFTEGVVDKLIGVLCKLGLSTLLIETKKRTGDLIDLTGDKKRKALVKLVLTPYGELKEIRKSLLRISNGEDSYVSRRKDWIKAQNSKNKKEYLDGLSQDEIEENKFLDLFAEHAYQNMCRRTISDGNNLKIKLNVRILQSIGLRTCPYCNAAFIGSRGRGILDAQLDHFMSKSIYPFFCLCLYNLIPSCATCNNEKSDLDDLGLVSPFDEDADFEKGIKIDYHEYEVPVKYVLREKNRKKEYVGFSKMSVRGNLDGELDYQKNIEVFKLQEAYDFQEENARNYIARMKIYPKSQLEEFSRMHFGSRTQLERELFTNYFSGYDEEDRILSKMYKDLYEKHRNN